MKYAPLIHFVTAAVFLCAGLPEGLAKPRPVPGNQPPSHAQHPPGSTHKYTPTPRGSSPSHHRPYNPSPSHHRPDPAPRPVHSSHGPHGPGFYPPPPPPRIPLYLYPPVVVPFPVSVPVSVPVYTETRTETYYEEDSSSNPASDMKPIGIFKAFVYKAPDSDEVQQNGVAVFYINDQNLISGYFYVKTDSQPLSIQGTSDPQTGNVEFRVVGTSGTYFTKLNQLVARDKIFLTLEKENKEGKMEASEVGYLTRVQEKL